MFSIKEKEMMADPRLYSRRKTAMQQKKEDYFTAEDITTEEYTEKLVDPDNLTGHDLRILLSAEQELSQCKDFTRLFPRENSDRFLNYVEIQNYSDRLLHAWEFKYSSRREEVRKLLTEMAKKGLHLHDLPEEL